MLMILRQSFCEPGPISNGCKARARCKHEATLVCVMCRKAEPSRGVEGARPYGGISMVHMPKTLSLLVRSRPQRHRGVSNSLTMLGLAL